MGAYFSIGQLVRAVLFIVLQITLFQQFHLFNISKPFIYLFPILFIPYNAPKVYSLLFAFIVGIVVDVFSYSYGMNAAACVFIAYIKDPFLQLIVGVDEENNYLEPHANVINYTNFLLYIISMTFVHSTLVILLENFTFQSFFMTLFAILVNTLITSLLFVIIEFMFYRKARGTL